MPWSSGDSITSNRLNYREGSVNNVADPAFGSINTVGGADVSANINSAVTSLLAPTTSARSEGGTVTFPPGEFRVDSPIIVRASSVRLEGVGPQTSVIKPSSSFSGRAVIIVEPSDTTALFLRDFAMSNLGIDMDNVSDVTAIQLLSVRNGSEIRRVNIWNQDGAFMEISTATQASALISEGISLYDTYFIVKQPILKDGMRIHDANEISLVNAKVITEVTSNQSLRGVVFSGGTNGTGGRGLRLVGSSVAGYQRGVVLEGTGNGDSGRESYFAGNTFENNIVAISLAGNSANSRARRNSIMGNRYIGAQTVGVECDFANQNVIYENVGLGADSEMSLGANSLNNMIMRPWGQTDLSDISDSGSNNIYFGELSGQLMFGHTGGVTFPQGTRFRDQASPQRHIVQAAGDRFEVLNEAGSGFMLSVLSGSDGFQVDLKTNRVKNWRTITSLGSSGNGSAEELWFTNDVASVMTMNYRSGNTVYYWVSSGSTTL